MDSGEARRAPDAALRSPSTDALVAWQLGREPRGRWRVGALCVFARPRVILTAPRLDDGTPFPTFAWLTCPWLVRTVADLESAGHTDRWSRLLATDDSLAADVRRSADAYRRARDHESPGEDGASDGGGIAGQADPLATKCLHAHVASAIMGFCDPVGEAVMGSVGESCGDDRCGRALLECGT